MTWRHESAFTCLRKPLSESPLALETTAGIHVRAAAPFTAGDQSFRAVPAERTASQIVQSHASIANAGRTAVGVTGVEQRASVVLHVCWSRTPKAETSMYRSGTKKCYCHRSCAG
jgi:hypothetical protein